MTAHQDVAGLAGNDHTEFVARLRNPNFQKSQNFAASYMRSAADIIESLSQALREAEAERDRQTSRCKALVKLDKITAEQTAMLVGQKSEWMTRTLAAESRLAEAIGILEFYAEPFEYIKKHGLDEQTPDFYDELNTGERARAFIAGNGGKDE